MGWGARKGCLVVVGWGTRKGCLVVVGWGTRKGCLVVWGGCLNAVEISGRKVVTGSVLGRKVVLKILGRGVVLTTNLANLLSTSESS